MTPARLSSFAIHVFWIHFRDLLCLLIIMLWHAHHQQAFDLFSAGSEAACAMQLFATWTTVPGHTTGVTSLGNCF